MVTIVQWLLWAVIQVVLISIACGISRWRIVVYLQTITPLFAPVSALIFIVSLIGGNLGLAMASGLQVLWILGLFYQLRFWHRSRKTRFDSPSLATLRVAHSNLLHSNETPERAVDDVFSTNADVIAFSEITIHLHLHAEQHVLAANWPHRIHDLQDGPRGIALWSKLPLVESAIEVMHDCNAATATIQVTHDRFIRVLAVHPMAPVSRQKTRDWAPSLHSIGNALFDSAHPTIAIGDYNATHWHPPMRTLYKRGLHSAHVRLNRIFASTFPVGRRIRPFMTLDHALVTENIVVHDVTHIRVSGSDHRGIVVAVSADN